ncbi:iron ABC transporter permease [Arcanobacterium haemolyticum]|uniref:Transport system permease protein n=1 Tax=Arcanobacterium haemolyticum (strain ATCC 9345 / DSM 20595 / CCM 5947 / CCUG 17215 / LMG 16163 / NBRC 15585 / NCTC 8452 / 11018) TaxID=644284 RepID=D7BNH2_ARCHD|nr:iron ABC transporter permease [Arcanobacterium haemolyticum]ADH92471.1 transport system permease protein [Arcanobacterium haemolyticum DSM 20595]QCX46600.1 iron ABC transporter permease [Arcanobacterium haemolyticum]SQH28799.1 Iron(III) dicitrate transport system permease protein fecD [Arcanobacterium haemolyticum]
MRTRFALVLTIVCVFLVVACIVGLSIGAVQKSFSEVVTGFFAGESLYWRYRMPRVVVGVLAGCGMAISGCLLQTALRNPLASPDTLGVTAGGGLFAVIALLGAGSLPATMLTSIAFVGSLVGAGLVFLAAGKGVNDPARMALTGVAVSVGLGTLTQLLLVRAAPEAGAAMTWLKGSLYARTMSDAATVAPMVAVGFVAAIALSRHLDALVLSDETMAGIGVRTKTLRLSALALAVLCGSAAVAAAGVLGFVGLIIPHAAKLLVGQALSRQLPVAAIGGAALVVAADAVGRWSFAPTEIPVGALIALAGAPYFIYLVMNVTSIDRT